MIEAPHVQQAAVHLVRRFGEGLVVAQTAAERVPERIDPQFRTACDDLPHAGFDLGRIVVPAHFVSQRDDALRGIFLEKLPALRLEDVDDRHVHHVVSVFREFCRDGLHRTFAFDEHLIRDAQLLGDGEREVVIFVALVDIHRDAVLADGERFAQGRHFERGLHAVAGFQHAAPDRVVGDVADAAAAVGRAVDRLVVAQDQHAVLGELEVQFHDVYPHADHRFDRRDGVFGPVAPVSAVRDHHDVP